MEVAGRILLLALTLAAAGNLRADTAGGAVGDLRGPTVGDQVRIHLAGAASGPMVGTLTAVNDKTLTVRTSARFEPVAVAQQDISRLERRTRPGKKGKGALIGLGVGFAIGFALDAITSDCSESHAHDNCVSGYSVLSGVVFGAAGAGLGALVAPGERWGDVPVTNHRDQPPRGAGLTIVPRIGRGNRGVAIVVSF